MPFMNLSNCKLLLFGLTGILHQQTSMDFNRNQVTASLFINLAHALRFLPIFEILLSGYFFILPRISKSFNFFAKLFVTVSMVGASVTFVLGLIRMSIPQVGLY